MRRGAGLLTTIAVAALVPATALAQDPPDEEQRFRARDLSVIENLLSEGVQHAIERSVGEMNLTNRRVQEEAVAAGEDPEIRYMFRSSGQTQTRGMFLEDYGVIFTLQVPNLSYSHSLFVSGNGAGSFEIITPDALIAGELAQEVQLRAQMSRMKGEIASLTQRLQGEAEASGATSANAQRLRASIAELESAYEEYAAEAELVSDRPIADEGRRDRGARGFGGLRFLSAANPEAMARAEELLDEQKTLIEGAVIEAVVDTIASYGNVIHGLAPENRLAVVLLPESYLDRISSWLRATRRAEEFVVSARFADIAALRDGDIDTEEFGARIRIESRLGQPRRERQ